MIKINIIIKKYRYHFIGFLTMAAILIWLPIISYGNDGLKAWFFDVGQGDAEFLDFFDGTQILIDGGPDGSVLQKLGKAMPFYDKNIDLVVLTHPHKDHVFGLVEVLKRYKVRKIILPKVDFESPFYREFLNEAKSKNISLEYLSEGDFIRIGDFAELDFINPSAGSKLDRDIFYSKNESFGLSGQQLNDTSLVFKLVFGGISALFTGDAGFDVEDNILLQKYNLKADILKVGHHGSKYSSSEDFLKLINPKHAVIEVGKNNKYGHPTEKTINSILNIGAKILRTDVNGDILFKSNGSDMVLTN